ncbi:hypothetical protein JAAARDRAFT_152054 [Jaapia argillacea MUCL 33604]|uniref:Uncharacterized protein n=1 Tax=Jaapia argillacea MUCL 33604 TaxID=933084 RepID=A0A067Q266_9AGAM|nr:hypothetical protein JAAARDRAFT_152054 [Jaapia argillacea MUCL 33604]
MQVDRGATPPPRKRLRHDDDAPPPSKPQPRPRLFAPFRALGLITNNVPFVLQTRSFKGQTDGPRIHILTCLGRSWALWEGGKMALLFVGPDAEDHINSLCMDGDAVWAAAGSHVIKYLRGKEVARVSNPLTTPLASITIFGSQLLALTQDGSRLLVWDKDDGELQTTIQFGSNFTATSLLHPATYLNKILIASTQGSLQLWNIRTQTLIHTFPNSALTSSPATSQPSPITSLIQSPAVDVVGIGFANGEISVYDVRADERLMRMRLDGGVRALGFRSDGHPVLAAASSTGHIALFDLNAGGRLLHLVRGAHDGAICALEWVPGQPVLISSGEDNCVKQWLFDTPTSPPRLLKFRSGHHSPPHLIRFYGEDGKTLLTAGRDRCLRVLSVVRDERSFEMSQGSLAKKSTALSLPLSSLKYPPITSLAFSTTRAKDWDDVLTAHMDESVARTWTVSNKRVGKHTFGFESGKSKATAKAVGSVKTVCVSACGNFGFGANSIGEIYMWNMQSGIKRRSFELPSADGGGGKRKKGEGRCVTGLACDALNRVVIASTLDGTINFFDFHTATLETTIVLPSAAVSITLQRDSGLLGVVCDDLVVRIVDVESRKVVREMSGFRGRVLDIAFSPDSRWLVTTSLDSTIRTFDIPTNTLIDIFRTSSVATSIAFSPTNDFLATAHVDSVGVYLWANRAQYAEVSFRSVGEEEVEEVGLPSMQGSDEDLALEALSALTIQQEKPKDLFITPPQLEGDLITLTLLPRARWQTLLNLEVIQQRNKPKEPPKPPEKAPFFLPTLPGVEHRFNVAEQKTVEEEKKNKSKKDSRRLKNAASGSESVFYKRLEEEDPEGNYESFFTYTKSLSPAAIDLELRSLTSLSSLRLFLNALLQRLLSHRDFEAVQTLLAVFLRMHGEVFVAGVELKGDLERLLEVQKRETERVGELIDSCLGILAFVRDTL